MKARDAEALEIGKKLLDKKDKQLANEKEYMFVAKKFAELVQEALVAGKKCCISVWSTDDGADGVIHKFSDFRPCPSKEIKKSLGISQFNDDYTLHSEWPKWDLGCFIRYEKLYEDGSGGISIWVSAGYAWQYRLINKACRGLEVPVNAELVFMDTRTVNGIKLKAKK